MSREGEIFGWFAVVDTSQGSSAAILDRSSTSFNEPRNVAIYLTRRLRGERLDEIYREFRMKRYSTASSVIERVRVRITKDRQFKKCVDQLGFLLTKSQT